ncbi:hypothetical protein N781_12790 [Pontibacillus halophilus JSM 076056 = DSM 19796]|uniref:Uncharacterized protein n=1 Tax=Pontibacillus halophilus JSM 076056 = DSM 19796 TaxID=1385510 RepID=A0A0A5GQ09_9BACI|nr:hypothetical protein [Pontibacillus halophilus]KGX93333.1 hypothetical protein N781_12790 [Pontibacillus halophilus JSM 076056 = DSM 19796]
MKKFLRNFGFLCTGLLIIVMILLYPFRDTLFQEGNPFPVMKGIISIQWFGQDYVQISESANSYISKTDKEDDEQYLSAKNYMQTYGWVFEKQADDSLLFVQDGKSITVELRMYTKDYYVFEAPKDQLKIEMK